MWGLLVIVTCFVGTQCAPDVISDVTSQGYQAEAHKVTTQDGYILLLHRISQNNTNSSIGSRQAVLLLHGIAFGSNSFIYSGPKKAIAYSLADAGFDVWLGNNRGNSYSRHHTSLDPDTDNIKFFDYDYEDIALFDLPAMVDYVLATSKRSNLHYIGHSQGGTEFLVLNSLNSAYQSKFASAHLLAGLGYEKNFPNIEINNLAAATDIIYGALLTNGLVEMKPVTFTLTFLNTLMNSDVPEVLDVGVAVKEVTQFCQNFRDKSFSRWNYGSDGNLQKYGSKSPPSYNLTGINVNVTFHYSTSDMTQSEVDVLAMAKDMPKATARKIARSSFNNLDYFTSDDVNELVTKYIIASIKNQP